MGKRILMAAAALLLAVPVISSAKDMKGRFGCGFNSSQAPIGARYWFSNTLGADLGIGFEAVRFPKGKNTAEKAAEKEGANSFWIEAGIPFVVYPTEKANLMIHLSGLLGFEDDNRYEYHLPHLGDTITYTITGHTSTRFSIRLTPTVELWLTDNFSLQAGHGVEFQIVNPYKETKVDASYRFGTFAAPITEFGFHFYFK